MDCPDCDRTDFTSSQGLGSHRRSQHKNKEAVSLALAEAGALPKTQGRCPSCGAVVWAGGEPAPSEFPLTCAGVHCGASIGSLEAAL